VYWRGGRPDRESTLEEVPNPEGRRHPDRLTPVGWDLVAVGCDTAAGFAGYRRPCCENLPVSRMAKEAERTELHRTIWRIANELRGNVDG
jgi:hypothetical protein